MKKLDNHKNVLDGHRPFMQPSDDKIKVTDVWPGDVIKFNYDGKERTAFVVHPNWNEKLHALSLKSIDHTTLVNGVMKKFTLTTPPETFYKQYLKPVISNTDSYRTYNLNKITRIRKMDYSIKSSKK
jgi:hypothetical protein